MSGRGLGETNAPITQKGEVDHSGPLVLHPPFPFFHFTPLHTTQYKNVILGACTCFTSACRRNLARTSHHHSLTVIDRCAIIYMAAASSTVHACSLIFYSALTAHCTSNTLAGLVYELPGHPYRNTVYIYPTSTHLQTCHFTNTF